MRCDRRLAWAGTWLLASCLLGACSQAHNDRDDNDEPMQQPDDGTLPEFFGPASGASGVGMPGNAGSRSEPPSTAGTGGRASAGRPPGGPPIGSPFAPMLIPGVSARLEPLRERDFTQPADEVLGDACAQVFHIAEESEVVGGPFPKGLSATVTRVFDAAGRLLVDEEMAASPLGGFLPMGGSRRLQVDYDATGRVVRIREGALGDFAATLGSVVDLHYGQDGGFDADIVTTRVKTADGLFGTLGFCEYLRVDADGRPLSARWGCEAGEAADKGMRSFSYDAQGRPTEVIGWSSIAVEPEGFGYFGESEQWSIRWDYSVPQQVTVTWNELDLRNEQRAEVEQRLVRELDEAGRVLAAQLDYGNDGSFDERFEYTYDDSGRRTSLRFDFRLDAVLDLAEDVSTEDGKQVIERRSTGQWGDQELFHYSVPQLLLHHRSRGLPLPQSVMHATLERDAEGRVIDAELSIRQVNFAFGDRSNLQVSQLQRLDPAGYVAQVDVVETSLDVGQSTAERHAQCELTSTCAAGEATLPDSKLVACQSANAMLSYVPLAPEVPDPYLPPPLDRIEALRKRHASGTRLDLSPLTVRELVDY